MWVNDLRGLQKLFCRKSINIFSFPCPMLQHNNSFRLFCQIYLGVIAIVIYLYSTLSSIFLLPSFNKEITLVQLTFSSISVQAQYAEMTLNEIEKLSKGLTQGEIACKSDSEHIFLEIQDKEP